MWQLGAFGAGAWRGGYKFAGVKVGNGEKVCAMGRLGG